MKISSHIDHLALNVRRTFRYAGMLREKFAGRMTSIDNAERNELYDRLWQEASDALSVRYANEGNGYVRIGNGDHSTVMFQNLLQIDHPVTVKIARDKPYALRKMAEAGIPVPEFREFSIGTLDRAADFLRAHGTSVVKPAYGMAGGDGVTTNIRTGRQLRKASVFASLFSKSLLIERQVEGDSYRLLYLDGVLVDAIRRMAPSVTGDGRSSIRELVDGENARRSNSGGSAAVTRLMIDEECVNTLASRGLSPSSVPAAGTAVVVRQAVNDNSSNENERLGSALHPSIVQQGARAASVVGVSLAGVDLIAVDISRPLADSGGVINEVNVTPGLHYHYQVINPGPTSRVAIPVLRRLLRLDEMDMPATPSADGSAAPEAEA